MLFFLHTHIHQKKKKKLEGKNSVAEIDIWLYLNPQSLAWDLAKSKGLKNCFSEEESLNECKSEPEIKIFNEFSYWMFAEDPCLSWASPVAQGDLGSIPGSGRSPGEENGYAEIPVVTRECRRTSRKTTWFPPLGKLRPLPATVGVTELPFLLGEGLGPQVLAPSSFFHSLIVHLFLPYDFTRFFLTHQSVDFGALTVRLRGSFWSVFRESVN